MKDSTVVRLACATIIVNSIWWWIIAPKLFILLDIMLKQRGQP